MEMGQRARDIVDRRFTKSKLCYGILRRHRVWAEKGQNAANS